MRRPLHFGIFVEQMRQGLDQVGAFADAFDLVDSAEAWGVDGIWIGQLPFNPTRSVLGASMIFACAIASRTKRIRMGTAVHVLPLHHPLRVAEEVATVDHVSQGRFEFGVGRSGNPRAYDILGVPYAESQARFEESLAIIREAWKGRPFKWDGRFYRFENAHVSPSPIQQPHPPIRMAAATPDTFPRTGELGLPIFVGLRATEIPELRGYIETYRKAWQDAGHAGAPSVYLRIPVYAGASEQRALDEPRESITYYFRRQAEMTRSALGRAGTGPAERRQSQAERLASLSYDDMLERKVAFGSASRLIDRLTQLQEELTLDGIVAELNPGGLIPVELERQSLRLLAHQVMPAFK